MIVSNVMGSSARSSAPKTLPIGVHWLFVSILFVLCTWLAMTQAPNADPYQHLDLTQTWRQPVEQNAFLRLARISGDLSDIAVMGKHLWAVGQNGLIVASEDSGKSWRQQTWEGREGGRSQVALYLDESSIDYGGRAPNGRTLNRSALLGSFDLDIGMANWAGFFWPQANAASASEPTSRDITPDNRGAQEAAEKKARLLQLELQQQQSAQQRVVIEPASLEQRRIKNRKQDVVGVSQNASVVPSEYQAFEEPPSSPPASSQRTLPQRTLPQSTLPKPALSKPTLPETPSRQPNLPKSSLPNLKSVFFHNADLGWSVGQGGTLLRTTDGGRSWRRSALNYFHDGRAHREMGGLSDQVSLDLHKVFFVDAKRGWIVGAAGLVLRTEDGGQQWRLARQGLDVPLFDVWFADADLGWAVGDNGVILRSSDGGENWQAQPRATNLKLTDLHFSSLELGWAVGDQGKMVVTRDGGETWQAQLAFSDKHLKKILFKNGQDGWVLPHQDRSIIRTADGGQNWEKMPIPTHAEITSLTLGEDGSLWMVGEAGTVLQLTPRGQWIPKTQGEKGDYRQVHFHSANIGWLLAGDNMLYRTVNGGQHWQPHAIPATERLWAIDFSNAREGVAVGASGARWQTLDGGLTWRALRSIGGETPKDIAPTLLKASQFRNNIWAIGRSDRIFKSADAGLSWSEHTVLSKAWFSALYFLDAQRGWIGGENGVMALTQDGGQNWVSQDANTTNHIKDINFVDAQRGWGVTDRGEILHTLDGGVQWQITRLSDPFSFTALNMLGPDLGWAVSKEGALFFYDARGWGLLSQVRANLQDVFFQDQKTGWVVGRGALLQSTDGGRTWHSPQYVRSPGVWYWIVCGVLVLYVVYQVKRHRVMGEVTQRTASVADVLASDRPLQPGDPDPLNFGQIARGLSRFMRNPATEPPLTVAVTGEWGSGKSSLMNLLYHDLKGYGFTPVWFNAWHHQKGEQLLASLYANIRAQAVPGWFNWYGLRPIGLLFRLRLLYRRSARRWLIFLIATTLLVGTVTYLLSHPEQIDWSQWRNLFDLDSSANILDKILIGLLGLSPPIAALLANLRAFGLSPEKLMAISGTSSDNQAQMDPNARQRFAQEFKDVSDSLELGRMVIFIDDLDRCRKENVVEILEAINFLSVSGQCYIVVGMAEAWVKTCVALAFHDLAEHTHFTDYYREEAAPDDPQARLIEFAEQYLEKLINIRVPVPRLSQSDTQNLLPIHPPEADNVPMFTRVVRNVVGQVARYQHLLVWLCLVTVGVLAGLNWPTLVALEQTIDPEIEWQWSDLEIQNLRWRNGQPEIQLGAATKTADGAASSGSVSAHSILNTGAIQQTSGLGASNLDAHWDLVVQTSEAQAKRGIVLGELGKEGERASVLLRLQERSAGASGGEVALYPNINGSQGSAQSGLSEGVTVLETDAEEVKTPAERVGVASGLTAPYWQDWILPLVTLTLCSILFLIPAIRRTDRITTDSAEFRQALAIWQPWIVARRLTPRAIKRYLNRVRYIAMRYRPEDPEQTWRRRFWNWASPRAATTAATGDVHEGPVLHESVVVALSAIQVLDEDWVLDDSAFDKILSGHLDDLLREKFPDLMIADESQGEAGDRGVSVRLQSVLSQLGAAIERHQEIFNDGLLGDGDQRRQFCEVLARGGQG